MHGGGYQGGGSNESRLNGVYLPALTKDLVVVTINYRLNIFGFLAGTPVTDEGVGTGNWGILDQRAALRWTRDHIAAFGGDPQRVFLVGESAGGASVHNHLVREKSFGLFHSAGIESGGYTLIYGQKNRSSYDKIYDQVVSLAQCDDAACLRGKSSDELLAIYAQAQQKGGSFEPVVDGVDLVDDIARLTRDGPTAPNVPVLVGSVREDLSAFAGLDTLGCEPTSCEESDFRKWAEQLRTGGAAIDDGWGLTPFPAIDVDDMVEIYNKAEVKLPGGGNTKWWWAARHAGSDATMICPARRAAMWLSSRNKKKQDQEEEGGSTFLYMFTHVPLGRSGVYPQLAHHASEIPFVFHVLAAEGPNADKYHIRASEVSLSAAMSWHWRNMAATGTPNDADSPVGTWPVYDRNTTDQTQVFGDTVGVVNGLKRAQCDFWDKVQAAKAVQVEEQVAHVAQVATVAKRVELHSNSNDTTRSGWRVCDVSEHPYSARGDGVTKDTLAIRTALAECDEVSLPAGKSFLSGPLNLTSNQRLVVDGTLLASTDRHDYPLIAPLMGYGWGDDMNCFGPGAAPYKIVVGSLRYRYDYDHRNTLRSVVVLNEWMVYCVCGCNYLISEV